MSIIRVGLSETKKFAEGYEAIFGRKTTTKRTQVKKTKAAFKNEAGKKKKKPRKK